MSKMTIIDNDFLSLWVYPDKKIVHHQFHKFIYGQPFRDGLMRGAAEMKKYSIHKWLSDDRKNSAVPEEDTEWSQQVWVPEVMRAGWKYWAIVQPEKMVGKMNMKRHAKTFAEMGVTVEVFDDPDKAMRWLESQ